ncbi:MAG TPA: peptidoglycan recognition family protein [Gemmataceae bacterium]|nr:peptidoglycan recognition family protein [Gemmataceae bacterium]
MTTLGLALAGVGFMPACRRALGLALPFVLASSPAAPKAQIAPPVVIRNSPVAPAFLPRVWQVEANRQFDLYSNGLRVENRYQTYTQARSYLAFSRLSDEPLTSDRRTQPAGIVFHTTESHLAPFEEGQNRMLKREGEGLLEYVSRNHSYHFVIDRFGRVFRIVAEADYANHAGNSIWADQTWIYVNLNQSFFGVAFEARSQPKEGELPVNAAQVHAARTLTEMLRARYGIAVDNCVTHAQVSINPAARSAGNHTDWVANLPFEDLGLIDNYARPLPSITLFGFSAAALLEEARESPLARGLEAAEDQVRAEAAAHNLPENRYRHVLQTRYKDAITALHAKGILQENN